MFEFIRRLFKRKGASDKLELKELDLIINNFKTSETFKNMEIADNYYLGKHDILNRKIYGIGYNGEKTELKNVPNHKIVDNKYKAILDQKVNYVFSKEPSFITEKQEYSSELNEILDFNFYKNLFLLGKDAYKYGISWLYVYYNSTGQLSYKRFNAKEIIPIWTNDERQELDMVIRIYKIQEFKSNNYEIVENVELYTIDGVQKGIFKNGRIQALGELEPYFKINEQGFKWEKLPIIPFKCNDTETPLIINIKSIQDAINLNLSNFQNELSTTSRNTVLVVKNSNMDSGSFRMNLNNYGFIGVKNDGGVEKLDININTEAFLSFKQVLKEIVYENGKGVDAKSDRLGANPNQMNIQSMYSDIDLDSYDIETEFEYSIKKLLWFINQHLLLTKKLDFTKEQVDIVFNRDILINESQAIDDCLKSMNILSEKSVLAQHPWVTDVELELINKEDDGHYNFGDDNES